MKLALQVTSIKRTFISSKPLNMNYLDVTLTFRVYWEFKDYPHLKVTRCKKIINIKRGTLLKYTTRGFYIGGKYYKRNELNPMLRKIKSNFIYYERNIR